MNHRNKKILSYIISIVVVVSAGGWVMNKFIHFGNVEFTDNAQIQRQIVPINSRVQGYIKEIRFNEFQPVSKGDTLVIIDDTDLRLRVAQARADYQNALAGRSVTDNSIGVAQANVAVSDALIDEAKILMDNASVELERYRLLLENDAVTRQQFDAVETDYKAKMARYDMLAKQRMVNSSVAGETQQKKAQSDAGIDLAIAMLETAELNLSYTVITAPCNGYTSRKDIQVGQLVQPGQNLLDIVDTTEVWITANFKETQLKHIHIGSEVAIKIDAFPNKTFYGKVISLSTATGAALSLLPQDNSAGNFVKVRQRVPVRIELNDNKPQELLIAGMNVECEVKY